MSYTAAVQETWRHRDLGRASSDFVALVHYATLAASSHNTQPWKFELGANKLRVLPDFSRRCPAVDPDDHHLYVSLGCAVENLLQAARAAGLRPDAWYDVDADSISIEFEHASPASSTAFLAIPERRCTRTRFYQKEIPQGQFPELEHAGTGSGVDVRFFTSQGDKERVLEFVVAGNNAQFSDSDWAKEMRTWIRFGDRDALRSGDGLYGRLFGIPSIPAWLGGLLMPIAATSQRQNEKDADHIRSSPAIALFSTSKEDRAHQIEVGRCFQRFALQATSLGLSVAFVNQPVEVAALRGQFGAAMGLGDRRPDLVVRMGYGPRVEHSLRRPLDDVIAKSGTACLRDSSQGNLV